MNLSYRNSTSGKLIRYTGFILCLLIQTSRLAYSQLPWKDAMRIHEKSFNEELYITTDRDLYAAGEKVWFRIYKLKGLTLDHSDFGKVAYVDILDLENNPVGQLKIEMSGYSGSGHFILPDTLGTGNYILRSYTNWMQNFSKDLFAYKSISVINPFDKITNFNIPYLFQEADSVIFYPEGGHLQAGLKSKLGFRILDKKGNPVKMNGFLTDEKNDTLCSFRTGNNGFGFVSVRPSDQSRIYLISSEKKQHRKFPLPVILKEGILLTADGKNEYSQAIIKLNISTDYVLKGDNIYLQIYSSGLSGTRKNLIPVTKPEFMIGENDIPYGISHLSIVDGQGKILTDRWISREGTRLINYKINLPEKKLSARENIKIDISATDANGNPVKSDFSVSVVKSVTANRKIMGFEHCRQLPGMAPIVEDCDLADVNDFLVFYKPHDRFQTDSINGVNPEKMYIPELEGHLISGNLRDKVSGEPLQRENITLSFVGKTARCLFTKTDSSGNFNFVTKEHGLKEIVIQPLIPGKECYVDLNNPFPSGYSDYNHGLFCLDTNHLDNINNVIISMQINNIYEPFYQYQAGSQESNPEYNFYGKPDNSILMSKYIELTSVKEIVAELIPGVVTTKNNGRVNFRLTKPYQTKPFENGPLVLVDGVPVYDLNKVIGINSNEIEKVDVLIDRYFISGNVIDGILHFITKKGNLSAFDLDRSVFRMEYDLLEKKNAFYSPDYSLDSLKNNHLPDFRNTLYWNPDLQTGPDGKASAQFYSSDETGEYIICIDGVSEDGKRGNASFPLVIKNR